MTIIENSKFAVVQGSDTYKDTNRMPNGYIRTIAPQKESVRDAFNCILRYSIVI